MSEYNGRISYFHHCATTFVQWIKMHNKMDIKFISVGLPCMVTFVFD